MFTKTEQKRLLKMKNILEEIWDGKLNKYHLTVTQANIITNSYNQIVNGDIPRTIDFNVVQFFEKYGFHTEEEGIGWIITI